MQEGHYDLIGPDGSIILPQAWEQIIQPGWNITMQMWPILPPNPPQPPGLVQPSLLGPNVLASGSPPPPPPAPPDQSVNAEAVIDESDEQVRNSTEQSGDDISSGYGSSTGSWKKSSRTRRIANAFSALKTSIFRRRRRVASATASSTASSLGDAYV